MNCLRKTVVLAQASRRLASTGTSPVSPALKAKQEMFQVPDGRPVHLKGGPMDTMLYYTTMGLSGAALMFCFKVYYDLSVPRK
ncbi:cytochrome c oxidase subunit 7A2, mitochondrial [Ischnura elegans]|uniref:cytochrome c oxidase subunit 7A2, mitochondrial n=1 Tax=Ischnura elegans TaxID=197161 RepID=UPI001ED88D3D|nr:cytochrome c oxidase subunit 7A2, mitochondrial [Ischnura elegans]